MPPGEIVRLHVQFVKLWISLLFVAWLAACSPDSSSPLFVERWSLYAEGKGPRELVMPTRLNDVLAKDYSGAFELRAEVTLPPAWSGKQLSLSIPHQYAVLQLMADGTPHREISLDARGFYRSKGAHIWPLDPEVTNDGKVVLSIVGHRDWWRGGWFDTVPRIAASPRGDAATRWIDSANRWMAYVCCGMLLAVLFTYLVMFAVIRRGTTYLLYALQAALALIYPLFILDITRGLAAAELPTLGLSLGYAVLGLVYSANSAFGLTTNRYVWPIATAGFTLSGIATLDPLVSARFFGPATIVFLTAVLGHEVWRLGRLARHKPRPSTLMPIMAAMVIIALLAGPDMLPWIGLGEPLGGLRLAPLALTAYALLHFTAITAELVTSLRRADALNAELESKLGLEEHHRREIEHLNSELRRQVAERSKQLSAALGRLATKADGAHDLVDGDLVDDRYRIVGAPLGAGAMGTVYRCERLEDGRQLALKVLKTTTDARAMARFAREAQLASEISAPGVVGIIDIDFASSGYMYLVMELVDGTSLRDCNDRYGQTQWALAVLHQVAEGLATIHAHGVVHRDLKPANVLLTGDGSEPLVKITDFGISGLSQERALDGTQLTGGMPPRRSGPSLSDMQAALISDDSATRLDAEPPAHASNSSSSQQERSLTQTGWILGTPLYMAPELADGCERATAASDVFSLGVVAYEMLTGKRPFVKPRATDERDIEDREPPIPVREKNPDVPAAVDSVIVSALSDYPDRRPSANDFATAIAKAIGSAYKLAN